MAFLGESDDNAAGGVDVGVRGGQDSSEEDGVDDVGKNGDAGEASDNDERRGGGIVTVVSKHFVVVRDIETNEEDGRNEEGEDAAESPLDS